MKQYLAFFRNYKKAVIVSSILVIADVVFETVQPGLMSRIVETGVRHKDIGYILRPHPFEQARRQSTPTVSRSPR